MRKSILIILIIFLTFGNWCHAGISENDRKEFDENLKKIHQRNRNYQKKKEEFRKTEQKRRKQKKAKIKRKKELQKIADRNFRLAREKMIKDTNERVRNLKRGECTINELTGNIICK